MMAKLIKKKNSKENEYKVMLWNIDKLNHRGDNRNYGKYSKKIEN